VKHTASARVPVHRRPPELGHGHDSPRKPQPHSHDDQGDKVTPTARDAKSPFTPKAGLFATLAGSLRAKGSRVPSSRRSRLLLALATAPLVAACLAPSAAVALTTHPYESSFGPDGTEGTAFNAAVAVAVDQQTGDIYVGDPANEAIYKFDEGHQPSNFSALGSNEITGLASFSGRGESQLAVDSTTHRIYAMTTGSIKAFQQNGEPAEFSALSSDEIGGFGALCGVAVDANGDIYAGDFSNGVSVYAPSGELLTSFSTESVCNVAVDALGAVYVDHFNSTIEKFVPSAFPVTSSTTYESVGPVDPGGAYSLAVNPITGDLYTDRSTSVVQSAGAASITTFANSGSGALSSSGGIAVKGASSSERVYVSDTQGQERVDIFGPTLLLPDASTEAASVIDGDVTLRGAVSAAGGPPASCVFEYVEVHAEGFQGASSVPCSPAGPYTGTAPVAVSAEVKGLPRAAYRFRLHASNANGSNDGKTLLFNTFERTAGLPDGRAYELVSPPEKAGEVFPPEPNSSLGGRVGPSCPAAECLPGSNVAEYPMQSTANGEAVAYEGDPFAAGLSSGPNEYLARRTPSGWTTQGLSPAIFGSQGDEGYRGFPSDLSRGILSHVEPALSPEAALAPDGKSYANLYLRGEDGSLRALVTEAPPQRNPGFEEEAFEIAFSGANAGAPAFSHVAFEANDALTKAVPGIAPAAPEVEAGKHCGFVGANCNLYEWSEGELRLVNVTEGNTEAATGAVIGSGRALGVGADTQQSPDVSNAISADGRRIFWSEQSGQAMVRIDGDQTREIPDHSGEFITASAQGSQVLLSDGHIYGHLEAKPPREEVDLSQGEGGFQGILGASEDAGGNEFTHVYFIDTKALAVSENSKQNANGEEAEEGAFNLYAWSRGASPAEDSTAFIGRLDAEDNFISGVYGDWDATPSNRTAQVSADGRYLAFMSQARLTGYDNEVKSGGCKGEREGSPFGGTVCQEVFEYDSASGKLSCASCNPSGQRPLGQSNLSLIKPPSGYPVVPQPGNLVAEGRGMLFFESQDELLPHDTNGAVQDIYEWKPQGVGGCEEAAGCLGLISSGHAGGDSMFVTSTPSGSDAFFVSREQLVSQDHNDQLDLYDARVGGGFQEAGAAPCDGEACRGPVASAPPSPPPGSSVFSGPGNFTFSLPVKPSEKPKPPTRAQKLAKALKACAKKPKNKRRPCRAQARRRYGPTKPKTKTKTHKGGK
jgi:hypothetical protein